LRQIKANPASGSLFCAKSVQNTPGLVQNKRPLPATFSATLHPLDPVMKYASPHDFLAQVSQRNPGQPEFLQAVTEAGESLWPFLQKHPK